MWGQDSEKIKTPQGLEGLPLFDNPYQEAVEEIKNEVNDVMIEAPVNLEHPLYFHGWEDFGKNGELKRTFLSYMGRSISIVFGEKNGKLFFPDYFNESEENKVLLYRIFDDPRIASSLFSDRNKRELFNKKQKNKSGRGIEMELDGYKYIIERGEVRNGEFILFIRIFGSTLKIKSNPHLEKPIKFISRNGKSRREWVSDSDYLILNRIIKLIATEPQRYGLEKLIVFQH